MSSTLPATHVAPAHPSQLERVVHVHDDRNPLSGGDVEPWPVPLAEALNQSGADAFGDPATGGE
jgi:hypothetical protein